MNVREKPTKLLLFTINLTVYVATYQKSLVDDIRNRQFRKIVYKITLFKSNSFHKCQI